MAPCTSQVADYCREIETFLCQKNDGHLIRIVGPSFELVSKWAADGVPLKVAFRGIDRYFERYYRKGPRRRPVRIDFCEADVLDSFDEWRRALGLTAGAGQDPLASEELPHERKGISLPEHLERAMVRLTNARATGHLGAEADGVIDRMSTELDVARASARGVRGEARRALIDRLIQLDRELLLIARRALDRSQQNTLEQEAELELAGFRARMPADAYRRARDAAIDGLARERLNLPVLTFS